MAQLFSSYMKNVSPLDRRAEDRGEKKLAEISYSQRWGGGVTNPCFEVSFGGERRKFPETKLENRSSRQYVFGADFGVEISGQRRFSQKDGLQSVNTYLTPVHG